MNTTVNHSTHVYPHGYKLCLEVVANGNDKGKGTHISILATLMKGVVYNCLLKVT